MTGTLVLLYETGALSAGVIIGNYRGIYDRWIEVLYNTMALSTGVITGVDRGGGFIKYNTGALSTGVMRGENSGFCSTI